VACQVPAYGEHVEGCDDDLPVDLSWTEKEEDEESQFFRNEDEDAVPAETRTSNATVSNILFGPEMVKALDAVVQWLPAMFPFLHPEHKELSGPANTEMGEVASGTDTNRYGMHDMML
jgi:hypothetical protein